MSVQITAAIIMTGHSYLKKHLPAIRLIKQLLGVMSENVEGIIQVDSEFVEARSTIQSELSTFMRNVSQHVKRNHVKVQSLFKNTIRGLESLKTNEAHAREHGQSVINQFKKDLTNFLNQPEPDFAGLNGKPVQQAFDAAVKQFDDLKTSVNSMRQEMNRSILPVLLSAGGGVAGAVATGALAVSPVCGAAGCLVVAGAWRAIPTLLRRV